MRKLTYSMMVSLDGFVEGPNREIDWIIINQELHEFANEQARKGGAFLYGRRMYEVMRYWQTADSDPTLPDYMADFARIWKVKPKVVFSRTLDGVEGNARLVHGTAGEEITKLKHEAGDELQISGPTIAATAMELGLIDEYGLIVQPVVLGRGTPFFQTLSKPLSLRLLETRTFGSGVVYLRYENLE